MPDDVPMDRDSLLPARFPVPGDGRLEEWWPLFGLRVEAGGVVLRTLRDEDLPAHLAALNAGIHPTGQNPFGPGAWSSAPGPDIARSALHEVWRNRAETDRDRWTIQLGVWDHTRAPDGQLVGSLAMRALDFPTTRTVGTGSWIARESQGRGLGTRARAMALVLAFDHLGARHATTQCAAWNASSRRVTAALGYQPNGSEIQDWGAEAVEVLSFRLGPDEFVRPDLEVLVSGVVPVRRHLGLEAP